MYFSAVDPWEGGWLG